MLPATEELTKHNVHRYHVRVEAVRSGRENNIVPKVANATVPDPSAVVGGEPPNEIEEVRPRQLRNAVPCNFATIHIFQILAVNVNLKSFAQNRNPFDHDALGPMAPVEKRGNNREARPGFRGAHALLLGAISSGPKQYLQALLTGGELD